MMRRSWGLAAILVLLGAMTPTNLTAAKIMERIIARVNAEIITQRTYDRELQKLRTQLAQDGPSATLDARFKEASRDTLRDLIDQALLVQKAQRLWR